jgi:hypothetical protein
MSEQPKRRSLDEIKEHVKELHELELEIGKDRAWSLEDLEMVWEFNRALSLSLEKGQLAELEEDPSTKPIESTLLESNDAAIDAELLLTELETEPARIDADQQEEKAEDAEKSD